MGRQPHARAPADQELVPAETEFATAPQYTIRRRARSWEVRDPVGELVCLTVYKRGAVEVVRRLTPGTLATTGVRP